MKANVSIIYVLWSYSDIEASNDWPIQWKKLTIGYGVTDWPG